MNEQLSIDPSSAAGFRTLRGFITGEEADEPPYFVFSATLRIFGDHLDFDEIYQCIGLIPTNTHRKGERKGPRSPIYRNDMWSYSPDVPEAQPLSDHISALWSDIQHAAVYLRSLKQHATVDVFLGYRSNIDHAGIEIPHTCLALFTTLEIPFEVSIIIT